MPFSLWRWTKRKCTNTIIMIIHMCIQVILLGLTTGAINEGSQLNNAAEGQAHTGNVVDAMGKAPPPPEGLKKDEEGRVLMGVKHVGCDDGTVSVFGLITVIEVSHDILSKTCQF